MAYELGGAGMCVGVSLGADARSVRGAAVARTHQEPRQAYYLVLRHVLATFTHMFLTARCHATDEQCRAFFAGRNGQRRLLSRLLVGWICST